MLSRSQLWADIVGAQDFRTETKALIYRTSGGQSVPYEYTEINAPVITRGMAQSSYSVGNCVSASLRMSLIPEEAIERAAKVEIYSRVSDGSQESEWLLMGSFFVSKRETNPITGTVILTCYDAMLKAGAYNEDWGSALEIPILNAVSDIATKLGVAVDARTYDILGDTQLLVPVASMTMRRVLETIAAGFLGNFIITQENKLRLVPLLGVGSTEGVIAILGHAEKGKEETITGVQMRSGAHTYKAGTDDGIMLDCGEVGFSTADFVASVATAVLNRIYKPYSFARALVDPCLEIGDIISWSGLESVVVQEKAVFDPVFNADLQAPFDGEIEEEYPYLTTRDRIEALHDEIKEAEEEAAANLDERTQAILYMTELAANSLGLYGSSRVSADGSMVSYWHNAPTLENSTAAFQLSASGFFISTDGGQTWTSGFDVDGNAVMNVLSVVGLNAEWIRTGQISDVTDTSYWNLETGDFRTKYMYYEPGEGLHITADDGSELLLTSAGVKVLQKGVAGTEFGYNEMSTTNLIASESLTIGRFKLTPRANGNLSFAYIGG